MTSLRSTSRIVLPFALAALSLAAGCDCAGPTRPDDGGPGDGGLMDVRAGDVSFPDTPPFDAGPPRCLSDIDCTAGGTVCLNGICQPDPCAEDSPCEGDDRCRAVCVALEDPCEGVTCAADETCVAGECFPGCLPVACEGVSCPDGQYCDPSRGACADIVDCDAACGDARACHLTCTPRSACEGVTCAEGEFCRAGTCIENPCFGVVCERGEVCQNGDCIETCGCDPMCEAPARCIAGTCTCIPRCAADAVCGDPDGCGGFCTGTCPGPRDECNPDTGLCECIPECADDATCGTPNGCGGLCMGPCADGRACVAGVCTCTDDCLAAGMVDCGSDIPDTCMGSTSCTGVGTRCEGGEDCLDGTCCPRCPGAGSVPCGAEIPDAMDDGGDTCRTCSGTGTMCAGGTACVDRPGGGSTDFSCCGACADPSSVACGTDIPDVRDSMGRVCRDCTGRGTGGCGSGMSCASGTCCPNCASGGSVACGEPIPDFACRDCSGFGSMCPSGTSCTNPPGTGSDADARVCCGGCPSASMTACGAPVPDVMAGGTVCRDCGTGTMCASGSECRMGSCCPACPSGGSVACGVDIPDRMDAMGRVCRTCGSGTMCSGGTTCDGDTCCPACASASSLDCGVDPSEPAGCAMCPVGTRCPAGERCRAGDCCAPTCSPPSTRPCGDTPSDGCGGTCAPGTMCTGEGESCGGSPLRCACTPSCVGRRCGEADGCGGECIGTCDPGFVCSERPPPAMAGDYQCEPSACVPTCGLCQTCLLGECEPFVCAPGTTPCFSGCDCCTAGEVCSPEAGGCVPFG